MRVRAIVHQQICQIKWHLLACLGLIMVLPLEDAVVSFHAGHGFRTVGLEVLAISFGPLLAGLVACANVQGDLNDKRYIFWRSKPANVKKLMALKYVVGLAASLAILACPLVFAAASNLLCGEDLDRYALKYYVPVAVLIAVMTYSLCFGCNMLVRSTARAWLIGMLLAGFVLVFPFMLPLGFTDIVSDVGMWKLGAYPAIIAVVSIAALVCALYAAQHDWHLRTNLKGLLCVAAGLVLILLMLFSSQVANIKVLREREIGPFGWSPLAYLGDRAVFNDRCYVDVSKNRISLSSIVPDPETGRPLLTRDDGSCHPKGYIAHVYPDQRYGGLYKKAGNDVYELTVRGYFRSEQKARFYEKVCIRSQVFSQMPQPPASEIDISDCLVDGISWLSIAARLIDDTLVVCVNESLFVVDATDPGELRMIDKKLSVLRPGSLYLDQQDRRKEFAVPLVPIDRISEEEKIRFSLDLSIRFDYGRNDIYEASIVDIHEGNIAFFHSSLRDVARFEVTGWDEENVYCSFTTARPFTFLETITGPYGGPLDRMLVKGQKLYLKGREQLMVFDVRSDRRIRKLGHFVRMDCNLEDLAVLENGHILLCASWNDPGRDRRHRERKYLYLLENPR